LLPIIIITGRPNQKIMALHAGAGALFEKPLDIPRLLAAITELLAEPAQLRLARLTGQRAPFHHPAQSRERWGIKE
jgi:DNA-binding response OmpR family regulator